MQLLRWVFFRLRTRGASPIYRRYGWLICQQYRSVSAGVKAAQRPVAFDA